MITAIDRPLNRLAFAPRMHYLPRIPLERGEYAMAKSLGIQPAHLSEIRIVIADERKIFRQGLLALFSTEVNILVVGDSGDGLELVDVVAANKPDVVVLNINLPTLDGVSAAMRIRKSPQPPELVFLANQHSEALMREAFTAGAHAYLLQDCEFKELVFAIRKVAAGDYYLTGPAGHEMVMEFVNRPADINENGGLLTRRETEICRLLADGYSTKEVADRLDISVKTAETHRAAIMKKLRAKNVTDIVKNNWVFLTSFIRVIRYCALK